MDEVKRLSVIIPVIERGDATVRLHKLYTQALKNTGYSVEIVYIIVPAYRHIGNELLKLQDDIKIIYLMRDFGEATAIQVGVDNTSAPLILTLPAYEQIPPETLPSVFQYIDDYDLVTVKRWPRTDSKLNQLQANVFQKVFGYFANMPPGDPGCGIRLVKRDVFKEIHIYGDFHRFISILAYQKGFKTKIVEISQSTADSHQRIYPIKTYLARGLDIITVLFLTRFIQRPLRFFGTVGAVSIFAGGIGLAYLAYERLFLGVGLAARPLLVLFSLFIVLGVQLLAIGLMGETFIFTNAKDITEYKIKEIIN